MTQGSVNSDGFSKRKRILFSTVGSLGDLHPHIGLALELKRRGHAVTVASTEFYRKKIEELGIRNRWSEPGDCPISREDTSCAGSGRTEGHPASLPRCRADPARR